MRRVMTPVTGRRQLELRRPSIGPACDETTTTTTCGFGGANGSRTSFASGHAAHPSRMIGPTFHRDHDALVARVSRGAVRWSARPHVERCFESRHFAGDCAQVFEVVVSLDYNKQNNEPNSLVEADNRTRTIRPRQWT